MENEDAFFPKKEISEGIYLKPNERLNGAQNEDIFICSGNNLTGEFEGCKIYTYIFFDENDNPVKKDTPNELSGRFKGCTFYLLKSNIILNGSYIDPNFIRDAQVQNMKGLIFKPKLIEFTAMPSKETLKVGNNDLKVLNSISEKVEFCTNLEDSLMQKTGNVMFARLVLKTKSAEMKFLARTYDEALEAESTYEEIGQRRSFKEGKNHQNDEEIFFKFGFIPQQNISIDGDPIKGFHNFASRYVIYTPSGDNWENRLLEIQSKIIASSKKKSPTSLILPDEIIIKDDNFLIKPVRLIELNSLPVHPDLYSKL